MRKILERKPARVEYISNIINDVRSSGVLGKSQRPVKLFSHLLRKSLSGEHMDLSQYSIALDVLERPETFDSTIDSIVRVEMHRLRASLETYNAKRLKYTITIPPASYEVIVKTNNKAIDHFKFIQNPTQVFYSMFLAVAIFFLGYKAPTFHNKLHPSLIKNTCSELLPNVRVVQTGKRSEAEAYVSRVIRSTLRQQTSFNLITTTQSCSTRAAPIFNIEYSILEHANKFNIALLVFNKASNEIISSKHISGFVSEAREGAETNFYYKLVESINEISMPDGTMARRAIKYNWPSDKKLNSFTCIIKMYDSFSGKIAPQVQEAHDCLILSVEAETASLDNFGALAASYMDQARSQLSEDNSSQFLKAENILNEYGDEWMDSREITIAKIYYEMQRDDFNTERLNLILTKAVERFNSNPNILLIVAHFTAYTLGDWERAKEISDYVKRIYSIRDQSVFSVDAVHAYMEETNENFLDDCIRFYSENSIFVNILVNACARQANDSDWIDLTEKNLTRMDVSSVEKRMAFLEGLKYHNSLKSKIKQNLMNNL